MKEKDFMKSAGRRGYSPLARVLTAIVMMLTLATTGAWAEDGIVCTASDLGKVICTDGSIVAKVSDATAASKTAAAVIAYVDETNKKGLALALADDYGYQTWTDITSHSPAVTGGTWVLASETQWTQMITAMGSDGLRDGFSSVGGTNLQNNYYWSSTAGGSGHRRYDFDSKAWYNSNPNSGKGYGRACLVFDIVEAPAQPGKYTVAMAAEAGEGWTIAPAEATSTGVAENTTVTATYSGSRHVKSVTAVVKAAEPAAVDLDASTKAWADGKAYAVPVDGLTYSDAVTVSGNVTLTLTEGTTLTLNKGISLAEGATLTIDGTGSMVVNGTNESTASTVAGTGTLVLTSGTLTAKGGNGASTPGYNDNNTGADGGVAINGAVTVAGGALTATGGNGGNAGVYGENNKGGAGAAAISGDVTMASGTIAATGGNGGNVGEYGDTSKGGAGGSAIAGNATLTGGTLTRTDGSNGSVGGYTWNCTAGAGGKAVAGTVTNNGGTVK